MVEALFRRVKHAYLFLQRLTDVSALAGHVAYYIKEHNEVIPHSALRGATPLEAVTGRWNDQARVAMKMAEQAAACVRLNVNRASGCGVCEITARSW